MRSSVGNNWARRALTIVAVAAACSSGAGAALAAAPRALTPDVTSVTLYVDPSGASSTCTGPSAAACPTISEGVTAAEAATYSGEPVDLDIAAGTYDESVTVSDPNTSALSLVAAGAADVTLDDGDTTCDITVSSDEGALTVSGMTITDGDGGVCYGNSNAFPLTLTDDDVTYDSAFNGAGLYEAGSQVYLNGDEFSHDTATGNGGAIEVAAGASTAALDTNGDVFSNDTSGEGGAIYNGGAMTIDGDTFTDDSSTMGGAIASYAYMTVESSTFTGDEATANDVSIADGGAIYNAHNATLQVDSFDSDTATGQGGGVYTAGSTTITRSTFSADSAQYGGGLLNTAITTVSDSTFDGGSASSEGGDIATQSALTVTQSTVSNGSSPSGPGIYDGHSLALGADLIDNAACAVPTGATVADSGYNDESDNTCGLGTQSLKTNATIDAASGLAANGSTGPQTLAIPSTSSAVNLVPLASCAASDERGDARPGVSGSKKCDAGAYEFQGSVSPPKATAPTAPGDPKVKGGVKSLTISWTAPHSTGGDPILGYRVYCGKAKKVVTTHTPSATTKASKRDAKITHLSGGKRYYCRVVAHNAVGASPPSATKSAKTRK